MSLNQDITHETMLEPTQAKPVPGQECVVCRDHKSSEQYDSETPASACTHRVTVCKQCMASHIEAELNQKGEIINIKCPVCRSVLEFNDVKRGASQRIFERYDTLLLRKQLQSMPDFRWCKNAQCGSGQIHDGGVDRPIMRCHGCNELSCFRHDIPWHYEQTCEEVDLLLSTNVNDVASRTYVISNTKPCPVCSESIEKNGGCDHMTCRPPAGCGHEFCWRCLAPYDEILRYGNHKHRTTCQYYALYDPDEDEDDLLDDDFDFENENEFENEPENENELES